MDRRVASGKRLSRRRGTIVEHLSRCVSLTVSREDQGPLTGNFLVILLTPQDRLKIGFLEMSWCRTLVVC